MDIIAGAPCRDRINASFVERSNLTVRHFNKRFACLGLGWSRKLDNHRAAISLFVAVFDFCKVHQTLVAQLVVLSMLASWKFTAGSWARRS